MYQKSFTKRFKKSTRKIIRSGNIKREHLESLIDLLASGKNIDPKYRDHALVGDFLGYRECHLKPNVLLVYKIEKKILVLILINIGSHAELFGK